MHINGTGARSPHEAAEAGKSQSTAQANANQPKAAAAARSGGDQLKLSDQAAQLQALEAEIANLPMVDVHRVEEVQQTLATNAYEIRPAHVAHTVLEFEAGLSEPQRPG